MLVECAQQAFIFSRQGRQIVLVIGNRSDVVLHRIETPHPPSYAIWQILREEVTGSCAVAPGNSLLKGLRLTAQHRFDVPRDLSVQFVAMECMNAKTPHSLRCDPEMARIRL